MLSNKASVFRSQIVVLSFSGTPLRPKSVKRLVTKPKTHMVGFMKPLKATSQPLAGDNQIDGINVVVQFDWFNCNSAMAATNVQL